MKAPRLYRHARTKIKRINNLIDSFNSKQLGKFLLYTFATAISLIFGAIALYLFNFHDGLSVENSDWGTFGDFLGGTLNPIFSFMSLTALFLTVVLQSRQAEISHNELELSRSELEATRNELERSASAQEKTEKIQAKQFFETTFFNLLELHHKLASELKFDADRVIKKLSKDGQRLFEQSNIIKKGTFDGRLTFDGVVDFISYRCSFSPEIVLERYKFIQKENNDVLGHYFRNLYQILKLIKRSNDSVISTEEKNTYASILRSQLSSKELALLFLNCLDGVSDDGRFRNLLIEFKTLEHLPINTIGSLHKDEFEIPGAFHVSKNMVLEYMKPKKIPSLDLDKYYGGAFGKNRGIPYDLARRVGNATTSSTTANGG